jgi:hypothetical protein
VSQLSLHLSYQLVCLNLRSANYFLKLSYGVKKFLSIKGIASCSLHLVKLYRLLLLDKTKSLHSHQFVTSMTVSG